jgi:ubiquinone biosynthesis protein
LRVPPVFPLLTKALVTAEGLARAIDPTINVYEVAQPYARRLLIERLKPEAVLEATRERAFEYVSYVEDYPEQIRLVLQELADGEIEVQLEHGGLDELLGKVDVLANRVVFALVTGALLLGSCMLGALNKGGPGVPYLGVQVVSFLGFTLSVIMGCFLLFLIFRNGRL